MLDLETLGVSPGCAIIAIGAVKFDREHVVDEF
jgi:DNA polymerase III epsilon subunit-like protein